MVCLNWNSARYALLTLTLVATQAAANFDGTPDAGFNPPVSPHVAGVPGLFRFAWDIGGAAPNTNQDTATAIAMQADGKMLVAGFSWNTSSGHSQNACTLARFAADGSLDHGFGLDSIPGGMIAENFGNASVKADCYPQFVAVQSDGRIVWGGTVYNGSAEFAWLARLSANGFIDTSFGGNNTSFYGGLSKTSLASLVVDTDDSLLVAGHNIVPNASDTDFYLLALDADGNFLYSRSVPFDLGADINDRANALVLQQIPGISCGVSCLIPAHSELYLVGSANNAAYPDMANRDCAVAAFRKGLLESEFTLDTNFGPASNGKLTMDFPVNGEGDNDCRVAISRPGSGYQQVGQGVVVGGENYFISTLGGGTPGMASTYALAEIDPAGNVTREDAFAFFKELATPGIYNGIFAMAREPGGRIVVTGYAGASDSTHTPSDVGVIRFNADYTRDTTFGNDGAGLTILSLDGALPAGQREWGTAIAFDNRGRIVLAGERSANYSSGSNDYDWLISRLNTSDVIFRDGFNSAPPPAM
ncbi:MAG: hypothetical protein ABIN56_15250 [Dokdonella sp.]